MTQISAQLVESTITLWPVKTYYVRLKDHPAKVNLSCSVNTRWFTPLPLQGHRKCLCHCLLDLSQNVLKMRARDASGRYYSFAAQFKNIDMLMLQMQRTLPN